MNHKYITIEYRNKIEVFNKEDYSAIKIAKVLGYHHLSISRELKRCKYKYSAQEAQKNYELKSNNKECIYKLTENIKFLIENCLEETWSPKQIIGRELNVLLSFKTIYNWLYKVFYPLN